MKTIYFIFVIMLTLFVVQISLSYGYDYACIDPGHGGPGASKYGCNGWGYNQNRGQIGPVLGLTEQWVNLQVGLQLEFIIDVFGTPYDGAFMTRYEDIDIDRPHRINIDKKACKILENY